LHLRTLISWEARADTGPRLVCYVLQKKRRTVIRELLVPACGGTATETFAGGRNKERSGSNDPHQRCWSGIILCQKLLKYKTSRWLSMRLESPNVKIGKLWLGWGHAIL